MLLVTLNVLDFPVMSPLAVILPEAVKCPFTAILSFISSPKLVVRALVVTAAFVMVNQLILLVLKSI